MTAKAPQVSGPPCKKRPDISTTTLSARVKQITDSVFQSQSKRFQRCGGVGGDKYHHHDSGGGWKLSRQSARLMPCVIAAACCFRRVSNCVSVRITSKEACVLSGSAVRTTS